MNSSLNLIVLAVVTIINFFVSVLIKESDKKRKLRDLNMLDCSVIAVTVLTYIHFLYLINIRSKELETDILIILLAMMYCILYNRKEIGEKLIDAFSVSNFITYVAILICYMVRTGFKDIQNFFVVDSNMLSWFVLGITVSLISYCKYEGKKKVLYGINLIFGSFLMFFGYNFLLCNMSLISGYVEPFKGIVEYNLEVSVYLEIGLVIIGFIFFSIWDRYMQDEELSKAMLSFYKGSGIAIVIIIGVLFAASMRDSTSLPAVMTTMVSTLRLNVSGQPGLINMFGEKYGMAGIAIIIALLCVLLVSVWEKKNQDKTLSIITAVYVIQSVFLKQTALSTPIYAVFIIIYLNGCGKEKDGEKRRDRKAVDRTRGRRNRKANRRIGGRVARRAGRGIGRKVNGM